MSDALRAQDGYLLGGIGGAFQGGSYLSIAGAKSTSDWSVVTFCRCDRRGNYMKLWESRSANSYSDYVGAAIVPDGSYGYGPMSFGAHITPQGASSPSAFAVIPYWSQSSHMISFIKRGQQLEAWLGATLNGTCPAGELSSSPRTFTIGAEFTMSSATFWRGGIGGFAYWNKALSLDEISSIYSSVKPSAKRAGQINCSKFYPSVSYRGSNHIEVGISRADGLAGPGSIVGTVKIKTRPASRIVRCFDHLTGSLMTEVWSDPTTGVYRINGLSLDRLYFLVSHDHERDYNGAIADYRFAEIL